MNDVVRHPGPWHCPNCGTLNGTGEYASRGFCQYTICASKRAIHLQRTGDLLPEYPPVTQDSHEETR